MRLQDQFSRLPGALGALGDPLLEDPTRFCAGMVEGLERMRRELLPAPTVEIGMAFVTYVDALLDSYRECPERSERAKELHHRAGALGRSFETLVNSALGSSRQGEPVGPSTRPSRRRRASVRAEDGSALLLADEQLLHPLCELRVEMREEVAVGPEGHVDSGVTKAFHDRPGMGTQLDE